MLKLVVLKERCSRVSRYAPRLDTGYPKVATRLEAIVSHADLAILKRLSKLELQVELILTANVIEFGIYWFVLRLL